MTKHSDPFILLTELARKTDINRTALELAIRSGKLTVITRFGQLWTLRREAEDWLAWRSTSGAPAAPTHQLEL